VTVPLRTVSARWSVSFLRPCPTFSPASFSASRRQYPRSPPPEDMLPLPPMHAVDELRDRLRVIGCDEEKRLQNQADHRDATA